MSDDDEPRRGRGRRRNEASRFSGSNGVATAITAFLAHHKNKGHIKDAEVRKVLPEFSDRLRKEISEKMSAVFGLATASDADGKTFYLYSEVCPPAPYEMLGSCLMTHEELEDTEGRLADIEESFLVVVLIIILMNSSPPSDAAPRGSGLRLSTLWKLLDDAGLSPPVQLGAPSKYIDGVSTAHFVSRGWLTVQNEMVDGEKHTTVYWGPLAKAVLRPMHMLELYSKLVSASPKDFIDIYKYAESVEEKLGPSEYMLFADGSDNEDAEVVAITEEDTDSSEDSDVVMEE
uniref:MAGE domain-containing protein n=1 Tax=Steinernema glaseri TaxID=37863 RepID=A0A1I7Y6W3_9BILA